VVFRSERGSPPSGRALTPVTEPGIPTRGVATVLGGWSNVAEHPRFRGDQGLATDALPEPGWTLAHDLVRGLRGRHGRSRLGIEPVGGQGLMRAWLGGAQLMPRDGKGLLTEML
jgi:hypothetical protein